MSDKWVLTKLNQVAGAMSDNLDHYEMGLAAAKINSFIWDVYCDWFISTKRVAFHSLLAKLRAASTFFSI